MDVLGDQGFASPALPQQQDGHVRLRDAFQLHNPLQKSMAFPYNIASLALFYFLGLFHELSVSVKVHIRKIFLNHIDGKVDVVRRVLFHDGGVDDFHIIARQHIFLPVDQRPFHGQHIFIGGRVDNALPFPPVAVAHQILGQFAVMP
ncbi:hypothetical protein SDC9_123398 [bioreactor metagenome]|uniref:Uncharacterized protein n=1 Tax=bioreactor metagenome TaxID=1076179 RepID=A0A645CHH7_9ZZZZ